jgi:hypothetical protein
MGRAVSFPAGRNDYRGDSMCLPGAMSINRATNECDRIDYCEGGGDAPPEGVDFKRYRGAWVLELTEQ